MRLDEATFGHERVQMDEKAEVEPKALHDDDQARMQGLDAGQAMGALGLAIAETARPAADGRPSELAPAYAG